MYINNLAFFFTSQFSRFDISINTPSRNSEHLGCILTSNTVHHAHFLKIFFVYNTIDTFTAQAKVFVYFAKILKKTTQNT
jgi:hypothetical protein